MLPVSALRISYLKLLRNTKYAIWELMWRILNFGNAYPETSLSHGAEAINLHRPLERSQTMLALSDATNGLTLPPFLHLIDSTDRLGARLERVWL